MSPRIPPVIRFAAPLLLALAVGCSGPERSAPATTAATTTAGPAAATPQDPVASAPVAMNPSDRPAAPSREIATFGSGCFWCSEAVLESLPGVIDVVAGYAGGSVERPTYEQVCSGTTGHAEVVQITFDPARISFDQLLDWFLKSHDPTTLNAQGPDHGTQYRSVVFYHSDAQKQATLAAIAKAQPRFADRIVTEVTAAPTFWPAETYHQDYFRNNPQQRYCRIMIAPKLKKLGLEGKN